MNSDYAWVLATLRYRAEHAKQVGDRMVEPEMRLEGTSIDGFIEIVTLLFSGRSEKELPRKHGWTPNETVQLFPVEFTTETKGFLTEVSTTFRTDDGRKYTDKEVVPRGEDAKVERTLLNQLSHRQLTVHE